MGAIFSRSLHPWDLDQRRLGLDGWLPSDFEQKKNKMKGSAVFNVTASHILIARSFDRSFANFLS